MSSSRLPFRNLLTLVPEVETLEGLRFALARHALTDPAHEWSDVVDTATIDIRTLDRSAVLAAVREAAEEARQEIDSIYEAVGEALTAALEGSPGGAAARLIEAGSDREAHGRLSAALRFFRAAHEAALPLNDRRAQVVALRRMARLLISAGDPVQAEACYARSADIARDAGEIGEEVVARTGCGNVHARIGSYRVAEERYREALALCDGEPGRFARERAQIMNNLAEVCLKLGRVAEAHACLAEAAGYFDLAEAPVDRAVWHSVLAHIRWEEGDLAGARTEYLYALKCDPPEVLRSAYAIDLADLHLEMGDPGEARRWGREAERAALAAGSVGYLTEVYRGLGNIERETGGEPVALYEKSLEIARKNGLRLSEAQTLTEYARLQRVTGNAEEARDFLAYAIGIFDELGASEHARKAREELHRTPAPDDPEPLAS